MEEGRFKHRGRPKAVIDTDLREMVLHVATRLFVQKGYGATTTEEIAVCCKISKQTLYRLFAGKAALFAAVIASKRPQWLDLHVPDDLPLQTALEMIFRINIAEEEDYERIKLLEMTLVERQRYPELQEILQTFGSEPGHHALAGWMQRQADKNRIKLAGDALNTAYLLTDMVFGSLLRRTIGEFEWRRGAAWRTHVSSAIEVFLHGVGQPT